jgi:hypothetical protein
VDNSPVQHSIELLYPDATRQHSNFHDCFYISSYSFLMSRYL